MKAALISLGSTSSILTAAAMKKYFAQVDQVQLKNVEIRFGKEAGIFYEGQPFGQYDCVYVKGSFRYANLLRSLAALLEKNVAYMPLTATAFTLTHNKLLTHLALQQYNLPMPRTYLSSTVDAAKALLQRVSFPIVMKFPEGTQGKGVMFADSLSSALSLLDALGALNQPFLIQEYVETEGTDIRALVVGEKVVAAMRRRAQKEEKRANIHAGGVGEPVQLTREMMKIAVDTAKALQADICGVDILEGALGPLVIEANVSPGLQELSKVSTLDIADELARFLARKTEEQLGQQNSNAAAQVMKELTASEENVLGQEIITALQFRGEKIILPELITKMANFSDGKEYVIRAQRGKVEIEEM
ncbi:MAG: RimK family alpha-L-glutamate ligase [Nanoarchaeota archaeon]|nr:RimK family alpha-L-glutamate ligase [Nanoarchaeota archaeon]